LAFLKHAAHVHVVERQRSPASSFQRDCRTNDARYDCIGRRVDGSARRRLNVYALAIDVDATVLNDLVEVASSGGRVEHPGRADIRSQLVHHLTLAVGVKRCNHRVTLGWIDSVELQLLAHVVKPVLKLAIHHQPIHHALRSLRVDRVLQFPHLGAVLGVAAQTTNGADLVQRHA